MNFLLDDKIISEALSSNLKIIISKKMAHGCTRDLRRRKNNFIRH